MAVPSAQEFHWQSLARLPSGRVYHTLSEVGGQMYMLGGCDAAGRPCPSLELYSPEVNNVDSGADSLLFSEQKLINIKIFQSVKDTNTLF